MKLISIYNYSFDKKVYYNIYNLPITIVQKRNSENYFLFLLPNQLNVCASSNVKHFFNTFCTVCFIL